MNMQVNITYSLYAKKDCILIFIIIVIISKFASYIRIFRAPLSPKWIIFVCESICSVKIFKFCPLQKFISYYRAPSATLPTSCVNQKITKNHFCQIGSSSALRSKLKTTKENMVYLTLYQNNCETKGLWKKKHFYMKSHFGLNVIKLQFVYFILPF